jgi:predicted ATP-grasp superfamily ATP-dependent carboligase
MPPRTGTRRNASTTENVGRTLRLLGMNSRIFVTDGHWRKSLAAVRALGRKGLQVTVGESTRLATSIFSKYCHRALVYPSPLYRPEEFVDFLYRSLADHPHQLLIPMEEETLMLVSRHRDQLESHTYIPVVSADKLETARRKDHVLELAQRLGIPTPRTWHVTHISQLPQLKNRLPYPVVIKPTKGSGAVGVVYAEHPEDLVAQFLGVHRQYPYPIIQELIPREGPGYGASFLMDHRCRVKAAFVHKRLREYPVTGGASTFRESVRRDDIRDMAQTLLEALDWFGVAMVEFKMDPRDRTPKLMEINPRFWGSLSLAVAAGVNFPHLLYRMSCGEDFRPVEHYQIGKRCRWLLPGDLLHFIHNPRRMQLLPDFLRFRADNITYDILSMDDPLPILGRILTPLTFLYDPDMKGRLRKRR